MIENPNSLAQEEASEDELFEHFRFIVDPGQSPLRLDRYLVDKMAGISRTRIQSAASAGNIRINEKEVKSSYKVRPDDIITILLNYPKTEFELIPQDIPLDIIYEDDAVLVVNKKPGMVVHPSSGHYQDTLVNALAGHLRGHPMFEGEDVRPGLVHRIDKDTSGLLVIGKSEYALSFLGKQFFNHTTKRRYQALVWGDMESDEGTIVGYIGRDKSNRKIMAVYDEETEGKYAVSHYKVLERFGYICLVECTLETGRTHQIRAHFKHIGHPLFNDADYGGNQIVKGTTFTKYKQFVQNCFEVCPRQALHAKSLGFIHPETKQEVYFETDLPKDISDCIEKWRRYTGSNH
jgi:23S rRNA pseudouridine1911/1915/1917 synthase